MTKIYNWNVNGIRAASKKGFWDWFFTVNPDIICVQETKADNEAMTKWWSDTKKQYSNQNNSGNLLFEELSDSLQDNNSKANSQQLHPNPRHPEQPRHPELDSGSNPPNKQNLKIEISLQDYEIIWHSCSARKGYSGTAIIYNTKTIKNPITKIGVGDDKFDVEGRTSILETDQFALINCYYPQGGREGRIPYKIEFYNKIIDLALSYKNKGVPVILCGDMNTTRTDIDLARPNENRKTTGCLPEEREVLERLIDAGYVDAFRYFYPDAVDKYTYWDQITRARDRNVGWRIDYFLVDQSLINQVQSCEQLDQIMGSDHCPVEIVIFLD